MSYPNIPLGHTELQRKTGQAVNHLLNKLTFIKLDVTGGLLDASQVLYDSFFPVPLTIVPEECVARARTVSTNDAVFTIAVDGNSIGTLTFLAGEEDGTFAFTETTLPALDDITITAPGTQDPTLTDLTICIAVET